MADASLILNTEVTPSCEIFKACGCWFKPVNLASPSLVMEEEVIGIPCKLISCTSAPSANFFDIKSLSAMVQSLLPFLIMGKTLVECMFLVMVHHDPCNR